MLVSQLEMDNFRVYANILASYQTDPMPGYRVPAVMDERYKTRLELIDAVATYGRFRQFQVKTTETIGKPPG